jgi:hypothetical protein
LCDLSKAVLNILGFYLDAAIILMAFGLLPIDDLKMHSERIPRPDL